MKDQGTRIIIYNLWEDDQGQLELDFVFDQHVCLLWSSFINPTMDRKFIVLFINIMYFSFKDLYK